MSLSSRTSRLMVITFLSGGLVLILLTAGIGLTSAGGPARAAAVPGANSFSPAGGADALITFGFVYYDPTVVTITVGQAVGWSGSFATHPLRQVDGPGSDVLVPGGFANSTGTFYTFQFDNSGTFYYQCAFHGLAQSGGTMRGKIVVLPAGGSTPTPTAMATLTAMATPTPTATATPTPTVTPTSPSNPMSSWLFLPLATR